MSHDTGVRLDKGTVVHDIQMTGNTRIYELNENCRWVQVEVAITTDKGVVKEWMNTPKREAINNDH